MALNEAVLRGCGFLREASPDSLARLLARAVEVSFAEDEPLWRMGDQPEAAHFVRRGLVQIVRRLPSGDEATIGLFGPRECAGLVALLGGQRYPAEGVAISDRVDVIRVPADLLRDAITSDPGLSRAMNATLVSTSNLLRAKIEVLTAGEISQRLATLFLHLAERFGDETGDDEVFIPLTLSRKTLARLVGARPETVIRVMTRWDREGLLSTSDEGFTVHGTSRLTGAAETQAEK
ncbi:Crp/Fnr family transcriptional regulator [Myxococcota bacterium]|nr:Crp/Fnr family transcriptional regulator [Myxococcota bacterium]